MNATTDHQQAAYDPGPAGIRWNTKPRTVALAVALAGVLIAGAVVWSAYTSSQTDRCIAANEAMSASEVNAGDTSRVDALFGCFR